MGQKGTGRRLSDQERMEIISKLEGDKPRASAAECARQYGVSSAAITKLMKMKDKIKQRFNENNTFSQQRKRGGTERHAAFEDELFQWITQQQQEITAVIAAQGILPLAGGSVDAATLEQQPQPLTSAKVQEKAQELLKAHNLGSFRASKGWYYRFCRRYGLSRSSLSAEDPGDEADLGVGHSGSDSEGSVGGDGAIEGEVVVGPDGVVRERPKTPADSRKRKDGSTGPRDKKKSKPNGAQAWAVQSLQDTLAQAAVALDHPEARQYLGEPAADEMLRSIQQSIGVVQCIRLKKTTASEGSDKSPVASEAAATDVAGEVAAATVEADAAAEPAKLEDVIV